MSHRDRIDPSWPFRDDAKLSPRLQRIKEQRAADPDRIVHVSRWAYTRACWEYWMRGAKRRRR